MGYKRVGCNVEEQPLKTNRRPVKSIVTFILFLGVVFFLLVVAVIPWPSTAFIVLGLCDSSRDYVAGECSVNTFNWEWCATDKLVKKLRASECETLGGTMFFDKATAEKEHQRRRASQIAPEK